MHAKPHMLMNAQPGDGSSGGGPPPDSGTPAPAPAQGSAASEPSMLDQIARLIDTKLADQQNGIFANLRKAGVLGKAPKSDPETNAHPSVPAEDVQALIARERAFNRAISSVRLNDTQFARMEKAFQLEKPEDPSAWVRSWTADLGIGQQGSGEQQPKTSVTRTAFPVSDGGAPAPVSVPSDQIEPWTLTKDDVASTIRRDGAVAAGAKWKSQLRRSLQGKRISLK